MYFFKLTQPLTYVYSSVTVHRKGERRKTWQKTISPSMWFKKSMQKPKVSTLKIMPEKRQQNCLLMNSASEHGTGTLFYTYLQACTHLMRRDKTTHSWNKELFSKAKKFHVKKRVYKKLFSQRCGNNTDCLQRISHRNLRSDFFESIARNCWAMCRGITKRCRLSWMTNSALVYEPKCGGGVGYGALANEHSCAHGAQINFGDLTPYLTYGNVALLLSFYDKQFSAKAKPPPPLQR